MDASDVYDDGHCKLKLVYIHHNSEHLQFVNLIFKASTFSLPQLITWINTELMRS